jgi:RecA-family ATPase
MDNILEALEQIDVSTTSFDEWLSIGMALKDEGYDCSIWDDWSKNDIRYKVGDCEKRWESFKGSSNPVTGGTIIKLAKDTGWTPRDGFMTWDDTIEFDGDGVIYDPTSSKTTSEQLITYLETLFKDDEIVAYVTNDVWDKEGKWVPGRGQYDRTAKELIDLLKKHPDDIGAVVGDWKDEVGAWIRFNPVDGKGVKNENVTRFKYALVESDDMPIHEQDALYRKLELPIACLVHSGGKSLHAIVKVDASDYKEYQKHVNYLYGYLEKNGLKIDTANRNPSRLSRMPGVTRNGVLQTLVDTNIGRKSWNDWVDFAEGVNDQLESFENLDEAMLNPPKIPDELISGVVRAGHKMIISGSSKAGKSFLLMELAVSLSEGIKWLGFQCKKSKVLYINLEIDRPSFINRFMEIYKALNLKPKHNGDIVMWNLRGEAMPLDKLVPIITRRVKDQKFDVIIIDPIYKVITGDENSAKDMSLFTNQFDKLCKKTGVTVIYSHHHSKGAQGFKKSIDRASGSGVLGRDPDSIVDVIQLDADEEFMLQNADKPNATAWRLESTLREFPNFKPVNFWFEYPIHRIDDKGMLQKIYADGDPKGNLTKSGKRKQTPESRKEEFDTAFDICIADRDFCTSKELSEYLGVGVRTIQKRVVEMSEDYIIAKGNVYKKEGMQKKNIGKNTQNSHNDE